MKNKKTYINEIIKRLSAIYPNAHISLNYSNLFELLIATILSAQCTDKKVNEVTSALFKKYKSFNDFYNVSQEELQQDIKQTGFFRNKAKSIKAISRIIISEYNGEIPTEFDKLVKLPGIGRKTANVVLGNFLGKAEGIVVDTHMIRLSHLLNLTKEKNPEKIESDLSKLIDQSQYIHFSDLIIAHGRNICIARKPKCSDCVLNDICPSAKLK
ncbi:endonuclease III [Patescibacteria group bacterium]|nr:endonuclease III [Patescibacteria group bacterium]